MFKKLIGLSLILSFVCCLVGCTSSDKQLNDWVSDNGKIKILSTISMIDDIVGSVGGEYIDHTPLIRGNIDPHSYELIKGDDEKLDRAHLIFCNGLGLEHGASMRYQLSNRNTVVSLGNIIYEKYPEKILYADGQVDPHIWMDIELFSHIIDPIVSALSSIDPEHAAIYEKKGQQVKVEMLAKDRELFDKLQSLPANKRFLVTSHDAFNYFTKHYLAESSERAKDAWRVRCMAPDGLAPDGQMSFQDLQLVIEHLDKHQIGVVFSESNVSQAALKKIMTVCLEKGNQVEISKTPLFADTMGDPLNSYLDMIEHNVNAIYESCTKH